MVQTTQDPGQEPAPSRTTPCSVADPRPNIVFVLTDDMRDDDLDHMPITRRLLADQGMEFTDAISPHPLCCPARAQLATGQYAQNNGVQHNRGVHGGFQALDPTREASSWFRDSGYRTGFVGKFLNGYDPQDVRPSGWTRWDALTRGVYDYVDFSMTGDGDAAALHRQLRHLGHRGPHQRGRHRLRRLRRPVRRLRVAPRSALPDHARGRSRAAAGAPAGPGPVRRRAPVVVRRPGVRRGRRQRPAGVPAPPAPRRSRAEISAENTARLRSLQAVDRAVGSLVDTLDEQGVLDDTYIVFSSDNGYSLGEHRFVGKDVLTDEALQVPLLVRGPGIAPGSTSDLPVTLVDLPATFAALTGVSPGWQVDGTSLAPTLHGERPDLPRHHPHPDRSDPR